MSLQEDYKGLLMLRSLKNNNARDAACTWLHRIGPERCSTESGKRQMDAEGFVLRAETTGFNSQNVQLFHSHPQISMILNAFICIWCSLNNCSLFFWWTCSERCFCRRFCLSDCNKIRQATSIYFSIGIKGITDPKLWYFQLTLDGEWRNFLMCRWILSLHTQVEELDPLLQNDRLHFGR